jgi:superoxide dismutase, Fe-Mn family
MFTLPNLPYSYDALEPFIDTQTMQIHHTKHHQAYVNGINDVFPEKSNTDLEAILRHPENLPDTVRQKVLNMGGGHLNHSSFWQIMAPPTGQSPEGPLLDALNSTFGDLTKFQEQFTAKALGVFGSGWAFLIKTPEGKLALKRHSFQNTTISDGNIPLLCLDVWEHAYYLKYQNRRPEYVQAFFNIINWRKVEENFNRAV